MQTAQQKDNSVFTWVQWEPWDIFSVVMCKEKRTESDSLSSLSLQGWHLWERRIPLAMVNTLASLEMELLKCSH